MTTSDLELGPSMWAVHDIEEARDFYVDVLGATAGQVHEVQGSQFLRCFIELGAGQLQLMQPLPGETVLTGFLEKKGEGLYGQVYLTDDLAASRERLRGLGVRVVADEIDLGDMAECVLHPSTTRGVLSVLRELRA